MTIYFIQMENEGSIKIGFTAKSAEKRMAQLQTGQPNKLRLLGTIPGEMDGEKGLHKELAEFRGNGEWFKADHDLLRIVQLLIEHQHPWYFVRQPKAKLLREKYESMKSQWVMTFSLMRDVDPSSFDIPSFTEISKSSQKKKQDLRALGADIQRKTGKFPPWVVTRINEFRSPQDKYLSAWGISLN